MSKSFYKNSFFYKKYLGTAFNIKQKRQDIALLFDRLTAMTSHPNLIRGFRVFNPTPEVVPVIRTKPLMFLLTSKKVK